MKNKLFNNRGVALLYALLVMLVLLTLGLTMLQTGTIEATIANNQVRRTQAMYAAEAGLETALIELKSDSYAYNPTSYSRNVDFQKVQPGNLQTSYQVSVASKGGSIYEITAIGKAGKAKYTQKAQVEIIPGSGDYQNYVASASGRGTSRANYGSNIIGDIVVNPKSRFQDNGVNHQGSIIEGEVKYPKFDEEWYLPEGLTKPDITIKSGIYWEGDFNSKLMPAINSGARHIKINGGFSYSVPRGIDFQGAILEINGEVNFNYQSEVNNVTVISNSGISVNSESNLNNVTFISNSSVNVNSSSTLNNVVLVGKSASINSACKGTKVVIQSKGTTQINSSVELSEVLIISKGDIQVNSSTELTEALVISWGDLQINSNATVSGSIICENFELNSGATLILDSDIQIPVSIEGLGGTSVKLQSWGVPPDK